jgi:hypothetical protein
VKTVTEKLEKFEVLRRGFSDEAIKWNETFLDCLRQSRTVRSMLKYDV